MPTALRRSKSLPALLAVFAALVVIATIVAVLIGNLMSAHRSQAGSDGTDDMASSVGRASRVAVVTPLSGGAASSTSDMSGASVATDDGASASIASGTLSGDPTASAATASNPPAAGTDASDAAAADAKTADATSSRHSHIRAAVHRSSAPAPDAMRMAGTLRADIARYNAERRAGNRAAVLRAASVPNVHSLWDEVPGPMSDVYRN